MKTLKMNGALSFVVALAVTSSLWAQQGSQMRSTSLNTNQEAIAKTQKSKKQRNPAGAQPAAAAASDNATKDNSSPRVSTNDKKKDKNRAKPAPSDQEKQFDKVLQGIYG